MNRGRRDVLKMFPVATGAPAITPIVSRNIHAAKEPEKIPELPWSYKKLDPVAAAERAYTAVPSEMMIFGEGGVAGVSSLCGALNGAAAAIFLLVGGMEKEKREKAFEITRELFNWYEREALPNYRPREPKFEIKPSVATSPLCHVSLTRWCEVTGFKSFSKERKERCGWVAASTVKYTAEFLNKKADIDLCTGTSPFCRGESMSKVSRQGGELENSRTTMDCRGCHFTGARAEHP